MRESECVLDATMGCMGGLFCFCPIEGDIAGEFQVVTGMNYLGALPPERLRMVAIIHEDGQSAVEEFCERYRAQIDAMKSVESEVTDA